MLLFTKSILGLLINTLGGFASKSAIGEGNVKTFFDKTKAKLEAEREVKKLTSQINQLKVDTTEIKGQLESEIEESHRRASSITKIKAETETQLASQKETAEKETKRAIAEIKEETEKELSTAHAGSYEKLQKKLWEYQSLLEKAEAQSHHQADS